MKNSLRSSLIQATKGRWSITASAVYIHRNKILLHGVSAVKSNKLSPPSTCLRNNLAGVAYFHWNSWNMLVINLLTHGKNNIGCRQICNAVFKHLFLMFQYPIKQRNSCFWFACRRYAHWDLKVCCLGFTCSRQHLQAQHGYILGNYRLWSLPQWVLLFGTLITWCYSQIWIQAKTHSPHKKEDCSLGHLQSYSCRNTAGPVLCNERGKKYVKWSKVICYSETKH